MVASMQEMTRTQIRIPKQLAEWLKAEAASQSRSMNGQLVALLKEAKKKREREGRVQSN